MGIIVAFSSILSIFVRINGSCCGSNSLRNDSDKFEGTNDANDVTPIVPVVESETVMARVGAQVRKK